MLFRCDRGREHALAGRNVLYTDVLHLKGMQMLKLLPPAHKLNSVQLIGPVLVESWKLCQLV